MNNSILPELAVVNGKITVTSRQLAEDFEKAHQNVIRDIENAQVSEKFRELNFEFSEYSVEGQSRKYKQYILTRNGFFMIIMGYRDEKSMAVKEAYIEAFDLMEAELLNSTPTISAHQLQGIRDQMANVTRYMKHEGQSLSQNLYRRMKAELGYEKIESMPPEQYEQAPRWLKPYETVAHKVWGFTGSIERQFIRKVKEQGGDPSGIMLEIENQQLRLG